MTGRNFLLGGIPGAALGYLVADKPLWGGCLLGGYTAVKYGEQDPGLGGLAYVTAMIVLVPAAGIKALLRLA